MRRSRRLAAWLRAIWGKSEPRKIWKVAAAGGEPLEVNTGVATKCTGSHGLSPDNMLDHIKTATFMATDRIHALRQVVLATRKGGRISIPGVYGGFADKFPIGALMEKGLQIKSGQTHVQKYMPELLEMVLDGKIDTTFLISHHLDLEDAAEGYKNFKEKQNEYTKVVLRPKMTRH